MRRVALGTRSTSKERSLTNGATMKCPKCDGEMVSGFAYGRSNVFAIVNHWVEREAMKRKLIGSMFTDTSNENSKSSNEIPITTFRCQSCGFLESYAR
jgi:hypothetical protein